MKLALLLLALLLSASVATAAETGRPESGTTASDRPTAEQLAKAASAARRAAEQELATARTAIAEERAALAQELQSAQVAATAARQRAQTASAVRDAAQQDVRERRPEAERGVILLRQLADQAVNAAQANENAVRTWNTLAPLERITRATTAIEARVAHLASRLQARQSVESVIARDGRLVGIPVLRLGEARAVALGDSPATRGLLTATAGSGSVWQVVGPMETTMASDTLPFDATDSLAGAPPAEVHHRTFGEWLAAGRFFIWPILATLALGSGFALWRFLRLSTQAVDPRLTVQVTAALDRGDVEGAQALVALRRSPLARVLAAGLAVIERDRDAREAALSQALIAEQPRLQAGLALILVLAGIAPLLGLLGTVTGMIDLFAVIAQQGSGNAKSLSGAISEALTTTQAGMIAAIPLLLVHAVLGRIAERRMLGLEAAAMGLIGIHLETRQVETTRSAS